MKINTHKLKKKELREEKGRYTGRLQNEHENEK